MKEKAARLNFVTGIAVGMPFLILGLVQKKNCVFYHRRIARNLTERDIAPWVER